MKTLALLLALFVSAPAVAADLPWGATVEQLQAANKVERVKLKDSNRCMKWSKVSLFTSFFGFQVETTLRVCSEGLYTAEYHHELSDEQIEVVKAKYGEPDVEEDATELHWTKGDVRYSLSGRFLAVQNLKILEKMIAGQKACQAAELP